MSDQEPGREGLGSETGAGRTGAETGGLRERLGALGERLDRLASSSEAQEARRRLTQAADELEERLREANLTERVEQTLNEVSQRVRQAAEGPRGRELSERLRGALHEFETDIRQTLESPRGQEWRTRIAAFLRDLGDIVERGRGDRPEAATTTEGSAMPDMGAPTERKADAEPGPPRA